MWCRASPAFVWLTGRSALISSKAGTGLTLPKVGPCDSFVVKLVGMCNVCCSHLWLVVLPLFPFGAAKAARDPRSTVTSFPRRQWRTPIVLAVRGANLTADTFPDDHEVGPVVVCCVLGGSCVCVCV